MIKKNKVTAELLLGIATEGLLYRCYQIIVDNKFPDELIIYSEESGRPCLSYRNLSQGSEYELKKFFAEKPWLSDMIDVEYKILAPYILYCNVYLKAKKKDYNFWYGYLLMKKNG